eukprot:12403419-Karenia_brevis.AAC.1
MAMKRGTVESVVILLVSGLQWLQGRTAQSLNLSVGFWQSFRVTLNNTWHYLHSRMRSCSAVFKTAQ